MAAKFFAKSPVRVGDVLLGAIRFAPRNEMNMAKFRKPTLSRRAHASLSSRLREPQNAALCLGQIPNPKTVPRAKELRFGQDVIDSTGDDSGKKPRNLTIEEAKY